VYVFEPGRGLSQLTEDGMSVMSAWAPAEAVAVRSIRDQDLIRLVSTFDRSVERLIEVGEAGVVLFADGWTPDRRTMLLTRKDAGGRSLWAFTLGDVAPAQLIDTKFEPRYCAISDDGKWLAYVRQERGRNEVYVRPYPALDRSIKISIDGGAEPFWARHREGLFYRHDGTMVFVPVETDPEFRAGTPEALFLDTFDAEPGGHRHYDLSKDGERFLMIEHQKHAPDRLHVVLNWTAWLAPAR